MCRLMINVSMHTVTSGNKNKGPYSRISPSSHLPPWTNPGGYDDVDDVQWFNVHLKADCKPA